MQLSDASSAAHDVEIDEDGIQETKTALAEASAICKSDNTLGYNVRSSVACVKAVVSIEAVCLTLTTVPCAQMNQSGVVERLTSAMRVPVVSMGVLHWLEVILQSPAFFNSTLLHICFPSLLFILKASIQLHTAQWPIAFRVLVTSLRLHPEINPVKVRSLCGVARPLRYVLTHRGRTWTDRL